MYIEYCTIIYIYNMQTHIHTIPYLLYTNITYTDTSIHILDGNAGRWPYRTMAVVGTSGRADVRPGAAVLLGSWMEVLWVTQKSRDSLKMADI
jgi:hypothetical protein